MFLKYVLLTHLSISDFPQCFTEKAKFTLNFPDEFLTQILLEKVSFNGKFRDKYVMLCCLG